MQKCPKCNTMHPDDKKFCNVCGTKLEASTRLVCPSCGAEAKSEDVKYCLECGVKFDGEKQLIKKTVDYRIRICSKCGHVLANNSLKFCNKCGNRVDDEKGSMVWGDDDKFYRVCTHCGLGYKLDEKEITFCKRCGNKLDLKPRRSPKPTPEEQKIIDERVAKEKEAEEKRLAVERKKNEERRQQLEAEEAERKQKEEERLAEQEQRRQKRVRILKLTAKISGCVLGVLAVIALIGAGIWKYKEKDFIAKGDAALAKGDYKTAIECYNDVFPLGDTHKKYQQKIATVKKAGGIYDSAKAKFDGNSYFDAMVKSRETLGVCSEITAAQDLYNQAQEKLGEQLQKKYDEKKYSEVYKTLSGVGKEYRSKKIDGIAASLDAVIKSHVDNGNAFLKAGKYTEAVKSADMALEINGDCSEANAVKTGVADAYVKQGRELFKAYKTGEALKYAENALKAMKNHSNAKQLKTDVTNYNKYTDYMEKAVKAYNNVNYTGANENYNKVKDDTAGKMVKAQYQGFINKLTEDNLYRDNPVKITDTDSSGRQNTNIFSSDYGDCEYDVWFTLTNRLNRAVSVDVDVEIETYKDTYHKRVSYMLGPKEKVYGSAHLSVYDPYASQYSKSVDISDFTIHKTN